MHQWKGDLKTSGMVSHIVVPTVYLLALGLLSFHADVCWDFCEYILSLVYGLSHFFLLFSFSQLPCLFHRCMEWIQLLSHDSLKSCKTPWSYLILIFWQPQSHFHSTLPASIAWRMFVSLPPSEIPNRSTDKVSLSLEPQIDRLFSLATLCQSGV